MAAGKSKRMGENKLNLPLKDNRVGGWALRALINSETNENIVVTREIHQQEWLSQHTYDYFIVKVEDQDHSMSSSIKTGLLKAIELDAEAILIVLADQPYITSNHLNFLMHTFKYQPQIAFVNKSNDGLLKPPMLISKLVFPDLLKLQGDVGAKGVLMNKWKDQGLTFSEDNSDLFYDVDTKEDYLGLFDPN
ncbi:MULTISPECIES: nucleotidyltransferase family protein [Bacillaceae]|uniref:Nucleotidyltransferase family protein n=1 Tax=Evansella alkalicola TaxID=745819 RepID=A0ABS6JU04_9BACI|nr:MULTISPECIES: nucleotidyltransferase family protein [Bacillaceae]MBU9722068.1 nucleotidyltransferase family protein [Bacillus alkalicola]